MFRTIYDKTTGAIQGCSNLSDTNLNKLLLEHPEWDYINIYSKGASNIAVDVETKKLKKLPPIPEDISAMIRMRRVGLLTNSDWTQMPDSPLSDAKKIEWATYRQSLRDMPAELANVNSIDEVVWPTPPQ